MQSIPQITPVMLQNLLAARDDVLLLDVRDDEEVAFCHLPHYVHIPMNHIPLRHNELPDNKAIVVYCHHGMRSLYSAMYLAEVGFEEVYNLQGGIDAWAQTIDPTMPRY